MKSLFTRLNFKDQDRIAIINAEEDFTFAQSNELRDIQIDTEIDQRYPYEFIIIFVKKVAEVKKLAPLALHNLKVDGILWFCYPKKTSKKYSSNINCDHGWESLNECGFYGIRIVSVDDNWSAMRFRNIKFIKSTSNRFPGKK
jgi:hypothetical protein